MGTTGGTITALWMGRLRLVQVRRGYEEDPDAALDSVGTYREGQSWVFPAFVYDVIGKNASTDKPARALVVLVTSDDGPRESEGDLVSIRSQDTVAAIGR